MTAIIASIAPGAAWLSTDSFGLIDGEVIEFGAKVWPLPDGWALAGAAQDARVLELLAGWARDVPVERRPDLCQAWLRSSGERATVLLAAPGEGFASTFEDNYVPHALEVGTCTCRPGFAELNGFAFADPWVNIQAFHLVYLRAAARAYRAGRITFEGRPSAIGGVAWSWASGAAEVTELGPLE